MHRVANSIVYCLVNMRFFEPAMDTRRNPKQSMNSVATGTRSAGRTIRYSGFRTLRRGR